MILHVLMRMTMTSMMIKMIECATSCMSCTEPWEPLQLKGLMTHRSSVTEIPIQVRRGLAQRHFQEFTFIQRAFSIQRDISTQDHLSWKVKYCMNWQSQLKYAVLDLDLIQPSFSRIKPKYDLCPPPPHTHFSPFRKFREQSGSADTDQGARRRRRGGGELNNVLDNNPHHLFWTKNCHQDNFFYIQNSHAWLSLAYCLRHSPHV